MRFGADHLYPPPPYTLRAPGTDVQQQQEVDESGLGKDLKQQSARMVMAGLDSHAQHALMQVRLLSHHRVSIALRAPSNKKASSGKGFARPKI